MSCSRSGNRLPESAKRLRGRIEKVLDAAAVRGLRTGENPARWRGHLQSLLSKPKVLTRGHHAALPYEKLPDFVAQLRVRQSVAAQALEFAILTACRSGEVLVLAGKRSTSIRRSGLFLKAA